MSSQSPKNKALTEPPETEPSAGKGKTVMFIMIIAAIGLVIFYSYLMTLSEQNKQYRPGVVGKVDLWVNLVQRSGDEIALEELKDKIIVAHLLSTEDPKSVEFLKAVQQQFRKDMRVQIVSLAVDPENETPDVLAKWAEEEEIKGRTWWTATGEKDSLRAFITRQLKLRGVKEVDGEIEEYDRRLVVIDKQGQIRGYYDIAHPDPDLSDAATVKFQKDMSWLLSQEPRIAAKLETSVKLTERSGTEVDTAKLDGTVRLAAYVYTRCPNGCAGVVAIMKYAKEQMDNDPRLRLMSLSLDPGHDTPQVLSNWANAHQIKSDDWWFLTGEEDKLQKLADGIGFEKTIIVPPDERQSEGDIFRHDMRIALIDSDNQIREFYDVMSESSKVAEASQQRLLNDLKVILGKSNASE